MRGGGRRLGPRTWRSIFSCGSPFAFGVDALAAAALRRLGVPGLLFKRLVAFARDAIVVVDGWVGRRGAVPSAAGVGYGRSDPGSEINVYSVAGPARRGPRPTAADGSESFGTEVLVFIFLMQSCEAPLRAPFGPPRALPSTRTRST